MARLRHRTRTADPDRGSSLHPVVATAIIAACASMGVFIGLTIYIPIFLEGMYGLSASQSGFTLIPLTIGTVIGAASTARVMARITHYKRPTLIGLAHRRHWSSQHWRLIPKACRSVALVVILSSDIDRPRHDLSHSP